MVLRFPPTLISRTPIAFQCVFRCCSSFRPSWHSVLSKRLCWFLPRETFRRTCRRTFREPSAKAFRGTFRGKPSAVLVSIRPFVWEHPGILPESFRKILLRTGSFRKILPWILPESRRTFVFCLPRILPESFSRICPRILPRSPSAISAQEFVFQSVSPSPDPSTTPFRGSFSRIFFCGRCLKNINCGLNSNGVLSRMHPRNPSTISFP